ncbi:hypothetical protein RNJ44_00340 [Nakaseomyces bracarensis]|uniref:Hyphally-regulated cell wall protein N-terminal domain-containing protein n=1 Tax=Nakaseomyces bracarensis TaxID=273131 RepID=A0ABR4NS93_9SACH
MASSLNSTFSDNTNVYFNYENDKFSDFYYTNEVKVLKDVTLSFTTKNVAVHLSNGLDLDGTFLFNGSYNMNSNSVLTVDSGSVIIGPDGDMELVSNTTYPLIAQYNFNVDQLINKGIMNIVSPNPIVYGSKSSIFVDAKNGFQNEGTISVGLQTIMEWSSSTQLTNNGLIKVPTGTGFAGSLKIPESGIKGTGEILLDGGGSIWIAKPSPQNLGEQRITIQRGPSFYINSAEGTGENYNIVYFDNAPVFFYFTGGVQNFDYNKKTGLLTVFSSGYNYTFPLNPGLSSGFTKQRANNVAFGNKTYSVEAVVYYPFNGGLPPPPRTSTTKKYSQPPEITTTVNKGSSSETDVISFFPTVGSDGKTHTGSTTYTLVDTKTYSQPPEITTTVNKGSSSETDVISFFPTVGSDGKTHTGSTTYILSGSEAVPKPDTETFSEPSPYTTTVGSGSSSETDLVSFFPTVGSDGKTHTGSTTYILSGSEAVPKPDTETFSEPSPYTTTVGSGSSAETDLVSFFPTVGSDGKTHTGSTTYILSGSEAVPKPDTETFSEPSPYTTTVGSGSSSETDLVSFFPTVGSDGKTHTGSTTYILSGSEAVPKPDTETFSEPSPYTTTVGSGSSSETDLVSFFPTVGSDGKTHTGSTTYILSGSEAVPKPDTETFSEPSPYTTTVGSGSSSETDLVSFFPTVGSDGKTHTGSTTYILSGSEAVPKPDTETFSEPSPYTTTVGSGSSAETDLVSFFPTVGSDGKTHTGSTTYILSGSEAVPKPDTETFSEPSPYTTTVGSGSSSETDLVSFFPTVGSDGKTHTGSTTYILSGSEAVAKPDTETFSEPSPYTTTVGSGSSAETDLVSFFPTVGSDGKTHTGSTTYILSGSEAVPKPDTETFSEPSPYTTTVGSGSSSETDLVSFFPTVGSDGKTHTGSTTYILSGSEAVPKPDTETFSEPSPYTTTVGSGSSAETDLVSFFPTVGSDGKTHTGSTTYILSGSEAVPKPDTETFSEPSPYTTTVGSGSSAETDLVSFFPTVGSDGKTHTGSTTYILSGSEAVPKPDTETFSEPSPYTTTVGSGSSSETDLVSFFPTVGSDGKTHTGSTTYILSGSEAVAKPDTETFSEPSPYTTTVGSGSSAETDLVSFFPTVGSDGKTHTGSTTYILSGSEAVPKPDTETFSEPSPYTTTVGSGSSAETDLVSFFPTVGSDGKTHTGSTTYILSGSEAVPKPDTETFSEPSPYTTTVGSGSSAETDLVSFFPTVGSDGKTHTGSTTYILSGSEAVPKPDTETFSEPSPYTTTVGSGSSAETDLVSFFPTVGSDGKTHTGSTTYILSGSEAVPKPDTETFSEPSPYTTTVGSGSSAETDLVSFFPTVGSDGKTHTGSTTYILSGSEAVPKPDTETFSEPSPYTTTVGSGSSAETDLVSFFPTVGSDGKTHTGSTTYILSGSEAVAKPDTEAFSEPSPYTTTVGSGSSSETDLVSFFPTVGSDGKTHTGSTTYILSGSEAVPKPDTETFSEPSPYTTTVGSGSSSETDLVSFFPTVGSDGKTHTGSTTYILSGSEAVPKPDTETFSEPSPYTTTVGSGSSSETDLVSFFPTVGSDGKTHTGSTTYILSGSEAVPKPDTETFSEPSPYTTTVGSGSSSETDLVSFFPTVGSDGKTHTGSTTYILSGSEAVPKPDTETFSEPSPYTTTVGSGSSAETDLVSFFPTVGSDGKTHTGSTTYILSGSEAVPKPDTETFSEPSPYTTTVGSGSSSETDLVSFFPTVGSDGKTHTGSTTYILSGSEAVPKPDTETFSEPSPYTTTVGSGSSAETDLVSFFPTVGSDGKTHTGSTTYILSGSEAVPKPDTETFSEPSPYTTTVGSGSSSETDLVSFFPTVGSDGKTHTGSTTYILSGSEAVPKPDTETFSEPSPYTTTVGSGSSSETDLVSFFPTVGSDGKTHTGSTTYILSGSEAVPKPDTETFSEPSPYTTTVGSGSSSETDLVSFFPTVGSDGKTHTGSTTYILSGSEAVPKPDTETFSEPSPYTTTVGSGSSSETDLVSFFPTVGSDGKTHTGSTTYILSGSEAVAKPDTETFSEPSPYTTTVGSGSSAETDLVSFFPTVGSDGKTHTGSTTYILSGSEAVPKPDTETFSEPSPYTTTVGSGSSSETDLVSFFPTVGSDGKTHTGSTTYILSGSEAVPKPDTETFSEPSPYTTTVGSGSSAETDLVSFFPTVGSDGKTHTGSTTYILSGSEAVPKPDTETFSEPSPYTTTVGSGSSAETDLVSFFPTVGSDGKTHTGSTTYILSGSEAVPKPDTETFSEPSPYTTTVGSGSSAETDLVSFFPTVGSDGKTHTGSTTYILSGSEAVPKPDTETFSEPSPYTTTVGSGSSAETDLVSFFPTVGSDGKTHTGSTTYILSGSEAVPKPDTETFSEPSPYTTTVGSGSSSETDLVSFFPTVGSDGKTHTGSTTYILSGSEAVPKPDTETFSEPSPYTTTVGSGSSAETDLVSFFPTVGSDGKTHTGSTTYILSGSEAVPKPDTETFSEPSPYTTTVGSGSSSETDLVSFFPTVGSDGKTHTGSTTYILSGSEAVPKPDTETFSEPSPYTTTVGSGSSSETDLVSFFPTVGSDGKTHTGSTTYILSGSEAVPKPDTETFSEPSPYTTTVGSGSSAETDLVSFFPTVGSDGKTHTGSTTYILSGSEAVAKPDTETFSEPSPYTTTVGSGSSAETDLVSFFPTVGSDGKTHTGSTTYILSGSEAVPKPDTETFSEPSPYTTTVGSGSSSETDLVSFFPTVGSDGKTHTGSTTYILSGSEAVAKPDTETFSEPSPYTTTVGSGSSSETDLVSFFPTVGSDGKTHTGSTTYILSGSEAVAKPDTETFSEPSPYTTTVGSGSSSETDLVSFFPTVGSDGKTHTGSTTYILSGSEAVAKPDTETFSEPSPYTTTVGSGSSSETDLVSFFPTVGSDGKTHTGSTTYILSGSEAVAKPDTETFSEPSPYTTTVGSGSSSETDLVSFFPTVGSDGKTHTGSTTYILSGSEAVPKPDTETFSEPSPYTTTVGSGSSAETDLVSFFPTVGSDGKTHTGSTTYILSGSEAVPKPDTEAFSEPSPYTTTVGSGSSSETDLVSFFPTVGSDGKTHTGSTTYILSGSEAVPKPDTETFSEPSPYTTTVGSGSSAETDLVSFFPTVGSDGKTHTGSTTYILSGSEAVPKPDTETFSEPSPYTTTVGSGSSAETDLVSFFPTVGSDGKTHTGSTTYILSGSEAVPKPDTETFSEPSPYTTTVGSGSSAETDLVSFFPTVGSDGKTHTGSTTYILSGSEAVPKPDTETFSEPSPYTTTVGSGSSSETDLVSFFPTVGSDGKTHTGSTTYILSGSEAVPKPDTETFSEPSPYTTTVGSGSSAETDLVSFFPTVGSDGKTHTGSTTYILSGSEAVPKPDTETFSEPSPYTTTVGSGSSAETDLVSFFPTVGSDGKTHTGSTTYILSGSEAVAKPDTETFSEPSPYTTTVGSGSSSETDLVSFFPTVGSDGKTHTGSTTYILSGSEAVPKPDTETFSEPSPYTTTVGSGSSSETDLVSFFPTVGSDGKTHTGSTTYILSGSEAVPKPDTETFSEPSPYTTTVGSGSSSETDLVSFFPTVGSDGKTHTGSTTYILSGSEAVPKPDTETFSEPSPYTTTVGSGSSAETDLVSFFPTVGSDGKTHTGSTTYILSGSEAVPKPDTETFSEPSPYTTTVGSGSSAETDLVSFFPTVGSDGKTHTGSTTYILSGSEAVPKPDTETFSEPSPYTTTVGSGSSAETDLVSFFPTVGSDGKTHTGSTTYILSGSEAVAKPDTETFSEPSPYTTTVGSGSSSETDLVSFFPTVGSDGKTHTGSTTYILSGSEAVAKPDTETFSEPSPYTTTVGSGSSAETDLVSFFPTVGSDGKTHTGSTTYILSGSEAVPKPDTETFSEPSPYTTTVGSGSSSETDLVSFFPTVGSDGKTHTGSTTYILSGSEAVPKPDTETFSEPSPYTTTVGSGSSSETDLVSFFPTVGSDGKTHTGSTTYILSGSEAVPKPDTETFSEPSPYTTTVGSGSSSETDLVSFFPTVGSDGKTHTGSTTYILSGSEAVPKPDTETFSEPSPYTTTVGSGSSSETDLVSFFPTVGSDGKTHTGSTTYILSGSEAVPKPDTETFSEPSPYTTTVGSGSSAETDLVSFFPTVGSDGKTHTGSTTYILSGSEAVPKPDTETFSEPSPYTTTVGSGSSSETDLVSFFPTVGSDGKTHTGSTTYILSGSEAVAKPDTETFSEPSPYTTTVGSGSSAETDLVSFFPTVGSDGKTHTGSTTYILSGSEAVAKPDTETFSEPSPYTTTVGSGSSSETDLVSFFPTVGSDGKTHTGSTTYILSGSEAVAKPDTETFSEPSPYTTTVGSGSSSETDLVSFFPTVGSDGKTHTGSTTYILSGSEAVPKPDTETFSEPSPYTTTVGSGSSSETDLVSFFPTVGSDGKTHTGSTTYILSGSEAVPKPDTETFSEPSPYTTTVGSGSSSETDLVSFFPTVGSDGKTHTGSTTYILSGSEAVPKPDTETFSEPSPYTTTVGSGSSSETDLVSFFPTVGSDGKTHTGSTTYILSGSEAVAKPDTETFSEPSPYTTTVGSGSSSETDLVSFFPTVGSDGKTHTGSTTYILSGSEAVPKPDTETFSEPSPYTTTVGSGSSAETDLVSFFPTVGSDGKTHTGSTTYILSGSEAVPKPDTETFSEPSPYTTTVGSGSSSETDLVSFFPTVGSDGKTHTGSTTYILSGSEAVPKPDTETFSEPSPYTTTVGSGSSAETDLVSFFPTVGSDGKTHTGSTTYILSGSEAVPKPDTETFSEPSPYTTTVGSGSSAETDLVSFFPTVGSDGKTHTGSTTYILSGSEAVPKPDTETFSEPSPYTTTVGSGSSAETDLVSFFPTVGSDGKTHTGSTTYILSGSEAVPKPDTETFSEPSPYTTTVGSGSSSETDLVSFFPTVGSDGKTHTGSTTYILSGSEAVAKPDTETFSEPSPYTTTVGSGSSAETDLVSFFPTVGSDGKTHTGSTTYILSGSEAVAKPDTETFSEPSPYTTTVGSGSSSETDLVSFFPTVGSDGKTHTGSTTYILSGSEAVAKPDTETFSEPSPYTTTVGSGSSAETDLVSFFPTVGSDGKTHTGSTTYILSGSEAVPKPDTETFSEPSPYTTTVGSGSSAETDLVSFFPTVGSDGKTHTGSTTYILSGSEAVAKPDTETFSEPSPYTTTVGSGSSSETDLVSFFPTVGSDGKTHTGSTTYILSGSEAVPKPDTETFSEPSPYTTTVGSGSSAETDLVSFFPTVGSDGKTHTGSTTYILSGSEAVPKPDTETFSEPSPYTTTVGSGSSSETDLVSFFPTVGSDGKTHTGSTTYILSGSEAVPKPDTETFSEPSPYTTTVGSGSSSETDLVSFFPTVGSDGKTHTGSTTYILSGSEAVPKPDTETFSEPSPYTTTVGSGSSSETDLVSFFPTVGSDGKTHTGSTTYILSGSEAVPKPDTETFSEPSPYTTTVGSGSSSETELVSFFPTVGSDGKTHTGSTTYILSGSEAVPKPDTETFSEPSPYTTTVGSGSSSETDLVSFFPTVGSDGKTHTGSTTYILSGSEAVPKPDTETFSEPSPYTTTVGSGSSAETDLVSFFPTVGSDGKTHTGSTTYILSGSEAVPKPDTETFSEPSPYTTTVGSGSSSETDLVSFFPTVGSDGKTHTGSTTYILSGSEAVAKPDTETFSEPSPYTTTVGSGSSAETDLVSFFPTVGSDGKTHTGSTTYILSGSEAVAKPDTETFSEPSPYTTTVGSGSSSETDLVSFFPTVGSDGKTHTGSTTYILSGSEAVAKPDTETFSEPSPYTTTVGSGSSSETDLVSFFPTVGSDGKTHTGSTTYILSGSEAVPKPDTETFSEPSPYTTTVGSGSSSETDLVSFFPTVGSDGKTHTGSTTYILSGSEAVPKPDTETFSEPSPYTTTVGSGSSSETDLVSFFPTVGSDGKTHTGSTTYILSGSEAVPKPDTETFSEPSPYTTTVGSGSSSETDLVSFFPTVGSDGKTHTGSTTYILSGSEAVAKPDTETFSEPSPYTTTVGSGSSSETDLVSFFPTVGSDGKTHTGSTTYILSGSEAVPKPDTETFSEPSPYTTTVGSGSSAETDLVSFFPTVGSDGKTHTGSTTYILSGSEAVPKPDTETFSEPSPYTTTVGSGSSSETDLVSFFPTVGSDGKTHTGSTTYILSGSEAVPKPDTETFSEPSPYTTTVGSGSSSETDLVSFFPTVGSDGKTHTGSTTYILSGSEAVPKPDTETFSEPSPYTTTVGSGSSSETDLVSFFPTVGSDGKTHTGSTTYILSGSEAVPKPDTETFSEPSPYTTTVGSGSSSETDLVSFFPTVGSDGKTHTGSTTYILSGSEAVPKPDTETFSEPSPYTTTVGSGSSAETDLVSFFPTVGSDGKTHTGSTTYILSGSEAVAKPDTETFSEPSPYTTTVGSGSSAETDLVSFFPTVGSDGKTHTGSTTYILSGSEAVAKPDTETFSEPSPYTTTVGSGSSAETDLVSFFPTVGSDGKTHTGSTTYILSGSEAVPKPDTETFSEPSPYTTTVGSGSSSETDLVSFFPTVGSDGKTHTGSTTYILSGSEAVPKPDTETFSEPSPYTTTVGSGSSAETDLVSFFPTVGSDGKTHTGSTTYILSGSEAVPKPDTETFSEPSPYTTTVGSGSSAETDLVSFFPTVGSDGKTHTGSTTYILSGSEAVPKPDTETFSEPSPYTTTVGSGSSSETDLVSFFPTVGSDGKTHTGSTTYILSGSEAVAKPDTETFSEPSPYTTTVGSGSSSETDLVSFFPTVGSDGKTHTGSTTYILSGSEAVPKPDTETFSEPSPYTTTVGSGSSSETDLVSFFPTVGSDGKTHTGSTTYILSGSEAVPKPDTETFSEPSPYTTTVGSGSSAETDLVSFFPTVGSDGKTHTGSTTYILSGSEAVPKPDTETFSEPSPYTTTVGSGSSAETDLVSFFPTVGSDGKTHTGSTTYILSGSEAVPKPDTETFSEPSPYTTTVGSGSSSETDLVSFFPTVGSDGKTHTGSTTYILSGSEAVPKPDTETFSEPSPYTTTVGSGSSSETDLVSFFPTVGSDGKTHTGSTTYILSGSEAVPKPDTEAFSEPSPYTTTVGSGSSSETDLVSFFPTVGSDGKTHTGSTTYILSGSEAVAKPDTETFSEPSPYTTTVGSGSSAETDLVSFFPTVGSDGKTHTGSTTYILSGSEAVPKPDTEAFSEPSPYTTTVGSGSSAETDLVSFFPTVGSDGKTHTGSTTYILSGSEAVPKPDTETFSEPSPYTTTVGSGSSAETDLVSFFPTVGSDGKTHTGSTTYILSGSEAVPKPDTETFSEPSPYTTTVGSGSSAETDLVSFFPTVGSDGKTHTGSTTYILSGSEAVPKPDTETFSEPSPYTTTVGSGSSSETDLVSFFPTVGSDGKTHTGSTTYILSGSEAVPKPDTETFSEPSPYTTTVGSGSSAETDLVSFFPTVGSDGKTHTGSTTYILSGSEAVAKPDTETFSEPSPYTTTVGSGSSSETDLVSFFPTVGSDGKTHTGSTTYILSGSEAVPKPDTETFSEPSPYTTTVGSGSSSETDLVSFFPTVGSDGKTHTGSTTYILSGSEAVPKSDTDIFSQILSYSQPEPTTTLIDNGSATSNVVVSYFPTMGSDGQTYTGSRTYSLIDGSTNGGAISSITNTWYLVLLLLIPLIV